MSRRMTSADWRCICGNTPCDGLDCGAYLIGETPRKKPEPKPPHVVSDIRKRAWETRRARAMEGRMAAAKATEAAIRRAITAWKAAGLPVGAVEVAPDGTIRITTPIDRAEEPQQRQAPKKWRG